MGRVCTRKRRPTLGATGLPTDDRAPRMRHVAVLLLLLLGPGLLLPAGLRLHVCRCPAAPVPAPSCCHAPAAAATPSCCQRTPTRPDSTPTAGVDDCGCQWLPLPERRGDADQPDLGLPQAAPALPARAIAPAPSFPLVATTTVSATNAPRAPPPPGRHRNLPLRL